MIVNKENTNNEKGNVAVEVNDVTIQGTIVHKFVTPKIAILTISTGNATSIVNYPKVLFFGDLREQVEKNYEVKDHVTIKGNIQSSRKKEGVVNQVRQSIFAESIERTPSVMKSAFNVESEHSHKPFVNSFKIAGQVVSLECPYLNIVRIVVRVRKNGRLSFVPLVRHTRDAAKILSEIHPNDNVCVVGSVQTSKSVKEDGTRYYENYVINEINKL